MQIQLDNVVQHRDGGLYTVISTGFSTVDQTEHVVYVHLYPFEQQTWIRPIEEFTNDRFRPLTVEEAEPLFNRDRAEFQAEITANKKARKG